MTFESKQKENKKFYEEIMYISSNYYIFKKRPNTKTHSLLKVFLLYSTLFLIFSILFLFIPKMIVLSGICFTLFLIYLYLVFETNYKLKEYMLHDNSTIIIDETGIESIENNEVSKKLGWSAIERIIINKYSISILPKNFAHFAIFIEKSSKEKVIEALKKYNKQNLLVNHSQK